MNPNLRALALLLFAAGLPAPAAAQAADRPKATIPLTTLQGLQAGAFIRIHVSGDRRLQGPWTGLGPTGTFERFSPTSESFSAAQVDSLWVRGRSVQTGALVGALLLGSTAALFAFSECEADICPGGARIGITGLALGLGAITGGLIGGATGAAIPRWRLRWP